MASFDEIGTGLFVIVLVMNLFLIAYGGQPTPENLKVLVPDGNVTTSSVTNPQAEINTNSYSVPTQTQLSNENDPFAATVSFLSQSNFDVIRTLLFGITVFAIKYGAPQSFLLAIIIPINIIMVLYLIYFIGGTTAGVLRSVFGK